MKISVIIPAYNEQHHIQNCLKSLSRQSIRPQEVIVVDDRSVDQTLKILKQIKTTNPKLKILKQSHQGPAAARNLAAKKAKGEILVFVDADMEFTPGFLKNLTVPIRNGQSMGTFSKDEYVKNWSNPWARAYNYCLGIDNRRAIPDDFPDRSPVFRAVLKSEFIRVGGFDTSLGYDDDWSLSERLGYQASLAQSAVYYHYNPASPKVIFYQVRWRATRRYKFGLVGQIATLISLLFLPIIIVRPVFKFIKFRQPHVLLAQVIFDLATIIGITQNLIQGKTNQ